MEAPVITHTLAEAARFTLDVSSVVTLNYHKTSFDRCIICDNYRYECLVPEKICLYCAENKNIVEMIDNAKSIVEIKGNPNLYNRSQSLRIPVTCYIKRTNQKVGDYASAYDAAVVHGIPRSSVFRSADCKNPLSRGVSSKALQCKIYFRYTK